MNSGLMWEQKSKQLLKDLIEKRIRSIIGVSMEAVENNIREERPFSNVRFVILKVPIRFYTNPKYVPNCRIDWLIEQV